MNKKTAKNAIFNIANNITNVIYSFVAAILVSRILGPDNIGKISSAQNFSSYFISIAALGLPTYGIRAIAMCKNKQERDVVYTQLELISLVTSIICAAAYIGSLFLTQNQSNMLYWIFAVPLVMNFANIEWMYKGIEEYRFIALRNIVIKIVLLILTVLCIRRKEDYLIYAALLAMSSISNQIVNLICRRKYVSLNFHFSFHMITTHLKPLMILLISVLAADLYLKIDISMLSVMTGDENVGFYTTATKITLIILSVVTSMSAVLISPLSKQYEEGSLEDFNFTVSNGVNLLLLVSIPACIGILFVSNDIVVLFLGKEYIPVAKTLMFLAPMFVVRAIGDLLAYQVVIAVKKEHYFPYVRLFSGIVNVIMNSVLIPRYQENGAAIASVTSEVINLVVLYLLTQKNYSLRIAKRDCQSYLIAIPVLVCVLALLAYIPMNTYLHLLASIIIGGSSYFTALTITRNSSMEYLLLKIKEKI